MVENQMKKIFLFDCDQTIWISGNNDFISSVFSPLVLMASNSIFRVRDGNIFILKPNIGEIFRLIQNSGNVIGIVSDNRKDVVINALKLFDIYKFIDQNAINIRLWKGYCPKQEMVTQVLKKSEFKVIDTASVYWFDDKDYSEEARSIGVNFVRVVDDINLIKTVKKLI